MKTFTGQVYTHDFEEMKAHLIDRFSQILANIERSEDDQDLMDAMNAATELTSACRPIIYDHRRIAKLRCDQE